MQEVGFWPDLNGLEWRKCVDAPTHLAQARSAIAAWQGSQAEEQATHKGATKWEI
jgi:hypothetical protein